MKKRFSQLALFPLFFFSAYVIAGGEEETSSETQTEAAQEYISQSDVTRDDYNTMKEFEFEYDECLSETSQEQVNNFNDPRHVVDVSMKICAEKLEALNAWFIEKRFPPNFSRRHLKKISSQSVRKVMPEVMFLMSQKQQ